MLVNKQVLGIINSIDPTAAECICCKVYYPKNSLEVCVLPWTGENGLCCERCRFQLLNKKQKNFDK